jgi:hypothetical protein
MKKNRFWLLMIQFLILRFCKWYFRLSISWLLIRLLVGRRLWWSVSRGFKGILMLIGLLLWILICLVWMGLLLLVRLGNLLISMLRREGRKSLWLLHILLYLRISLVMLKRKVLMVSCRNLLIMINLRSFLRRLNLYD